MTVARFQALLRVIRDAVTILGGIGLLPRGGLTIWRTRKRILSPRF